MKENQIVIQNEAPKIERFFSFIIDLAFSSIFIIIVLYSVVAFCYIAHTSLPSILSNDYLLVSTIIVLYVVYYFSFETITNGRSIGKYFMDTKVVTIEGRKPTTGVLFRRNLYQLIPLDVFSFLFGKGFHDTISKTRVVMKKDFEHEANK